jgi:outer membrane protein OmpA-like peptidoglycan-associated protein
LGGASIGFGRSRRAEETSQQESTGEKVVKRLIGTFAALALATVAVNSYADDGLQFELTPYLWGIGIDGKLTADDETVHFNRDFSDIVNNLDFGGSGLAVMSYNWFVLYGQYDYLSLSDDGKSKGPFLPLGTKITADLDADIWTAAAGFRFPTFGKNTADLLFGYRQASTDTKFKAKGFGNATNSRDIGDTIVMLRPSFQLSERWRLNPSFSYGISGDSDTTYELWPQFQYQFSDNFALRFGYRTLHYRVSEGRKAVGNFNELDGDIQGLTLGLGWTFPGHKEKAAPPPPPPPPPPPAKPAPPPVAMAPKDSDGDGVPDDKDLCPATPAHTRVDKNGCDCEVSLTTHFATNSAELTAADKEVLDSAAQRLVQLHFIAGEAHGYTDNTGTSEYNHKLSLRRAQAVVDYLKSKGVDESRVQVIGHGEEDPIASNDTKDGRFQNRRVVVKRTDCPM